MLKVNLIPPEEKKALHTEEIRRLILFFSLGLIGILVVTTSLLFPSFIIFSFQKQELLRSLVTQKQVIEQGEQGGGTTSRVERLKNIIASLRLLPTSSAQTSSIINILLEKHSGIEVTSMAVRKNTELSLAGTAETRDDLLTFEKFLNDSGIFQSISSPRSNLISEKSISFSYQGTLKPQYALKTAK